MGDVGGIHIDGMGRVVHRQATHDYSGIPFTVIVCILNTGIITVNLLDHHSNVGQMSRDSEL